MLTHLHSEHAGGIADFPHARIHVSHLEYNVAHNRSLRSRISYRHNVWAHGPRWELYAGASDWCGLAGAASIDADTVLVPLPGHTLGHCGVAVRADGSQWILHAGDAIYSDPSDNATKAAFPLRQYQWFSATDRAQLRHTQEQLRRLARRSDIRIISSHKGIGHNPMSVTLDVPVNLDGPAAYRR